MNAYTSSMIACSMEVVAAVIVVFIMERAGRRTFLYISSIGMCICHFILATYFTMKAMDITFCGKHTWNLSGIMCLLASSHIIEMFNISSDKSDNLVSRCF